MQATFEDALEAEALSKRHSLTREAVETGRQCGAYRTLLTHFSQRYPKIPVFDASFASSTCIAFDLMTVNLAGGRACLCVAATNCLLEFACDRQEKPCSGSIIKPYAILILGP